ncbi:hypothetical protein B9Q04_01710 [Candidatus Marsarchaeota G2 archaeon BE_D]|uniref:Uncharacterized protein n=1 Tax=Candidatus Marsarchaeota G2 archaeon BE_D TaxID=1978158 RepID=A0A2R6CE39_9ARCH|nr:MAG: hypothetical protein B9Q04_01710 [Candidatus Marsarchaeota G2 archaeon BE_D]
MDRLEVTYSKLLRYVAGNSLYQVSLIHDSVDLVFTADFPEAESHSRGEPARVIFHGRLVGEKVVFDRVQVDEGDRLVTKNPSDALYAYSSWLEFIEENY